MEITRQDRVNHNTQILQEGSCLWECTKCQCMFTQHFGMMPICICNNKDLSKLSLLASKPTQEQVDTLKIEVNQLLEDIRTFLKQWLVLNEEYYTVLPLWILGSYIHSSFSTYPFLYINAQKGSAKTRTLNIIANLAYKANGEVHTGLTESVLFRSDKGATLVIDEAEKISSKDKATLREFLNACYKKGGVVKRNRKVKNERGESYEIESFTPFRPIVLANINGMDEVLSDRCLTIIMEKSGDFGVTKLVENFSEDDSIINLKVRLSKIQCSLCSVVTLKNIYIRWNNYIKIRYTNIHTTTSTLNTLSTSLIQEDNKKEPLDFFLEFIFNKIADTDIQGRNLELFFPLLILAGHLNEELFQQVLKVATTIVKEKESDDLMLDRDIALIEFVSRQEDKRFSFISLNELCSGFRNYLGESDVEDPWLNTKWLGKAIRRLKLSTARRRMARGMEVMLSVEHAKEKLKLFKKSEDTPK